MADVMPTQLRRSPLAHLSTRMAEGSSVEVALGASAHVAMVSLRVDPRSAAGDRVAAELGCDLPAGVGGVGAGAGTQVLWLGPDEFLVVTERDATGLAGALTEAIGADPGLALDVSANRVVLELIGPAARRVLQKGCPVDLHPRAFGPGRAVSTTLVRVPVLLWQTGPAAYRLLPRASFADYTARWLLDAMTEFA